MDGPTVVDLFCGAGGLSVGFARTGFRPVLGIDRDPDGLATYAAAFGCPVLSWDAPPGGGSVPDGLPRADVVVSGPPCQGFSPLNVRRDGDGRRDHLSNVVDVAVACDADAFVVENVPEFLGTDEEAAFRARSDEEGYATMASVLCAADYGVPQVRTRAFLLGTRHARPSAFPPAPTHSRHAGVMDDLFLPLRPWLTVRDAIGDLPPPGRGGFGVGTPPFDLHVARDPERRSVERYRTVPPGGNRMDVVRTRPDLASPSWKKAHPGVLTDIFGRLWWDRPSVTVRTDFKPEKGRYLHPEQHRPITHREAARLSGFDDGHPFKGGRRSIARQIGNAVPPPLAAAIARSVLVSISTGGIAPSDALPGAERSHASETAAASDRP